MIKHINYDLINEYKIHLRNKTTGKLSCCTTYCCGHLYNRINEWITDLKSLSLYDVSNDTHEITYIENMGTGETVYKKGEYNE